MYFIDETLMDDYIYVNLCTQTNGMKFYIGAFLAKNKKSFFQHFVQIRSNLPYLEVCSLKSVDFQQNYLE